MALTNMFSLLVLVVTMTTRLATCDESLQISPKNSSATNKYCEISEIVPETNKTDFKFWMNISNRDPLVQVMWDVSHKHTGYERFTTWVVGCLGDLEELNNSVAPFLVMDTFYENRFHLRKYIHYDLSNYARHHNLRSVRKLYDEYRVVSRDFESYFNSTKKVIRNIDKDIQRKLSCRSKWHCGCLFLYDVHLFEYDLSDLEEHDSAMKMFLIFGNYIDPAIRIVLIITGIVLNGTLLLIFIRLGEIRKDPEVILGNLVFTEILSLIIYIPLQYIHYYYPEMIPHKHFSYNGIFILIQSVFISIRALSILALSCLNVSRYLPSDAPRYNTTCRRALHLLKVWFLTLGIALLNYLVNHFDKEENDIHCVSLAYVLEFLLVVPIMLFLCKTLYTKVLKLDAAINRHIDNLPVFQGTDNSEPDSPEEEMQVSQPSGILDRFRVVKALCITFWITHTPFFIWLANEKGLSIILIYFQYNYTYIESAVYYLLFLYSVFNPIAIAIASDTYRIPFINYLFPCNFRRKGRQSVATNEPNSGSEVENSVV